MKRTDTHNRAEGKGRDIVLAVMVFAITCCAGYGHLRAMRAGHSAVTGIELLYGPSVMLAQGRGFIEPDIQEYPELRAFLRGDMESLPPGAVPETVIESPSQVSSYHRYLVYTVAFFWWIFGISWTSLEPLLALLLAWSGVAVYGIMRLGMRRSLAFFFALVFMISPAMLGTLTELRDFSKAPFILSMLWGLGWLIRYRVNLRQLLLCSVFLGLLSGIGMGFRQDVFVFLPLSMVVLLFSAFRRDVKSSLLRLTAIPLCLCFFFGAAWPMFGRMAGAANPDYFLVQGFSTERQDNLGMLDASYRPLASGKDCYVFSVINDYAKRDAGEGEARFAWNSPDADVYNRKWILTHVITFPADLAARGYAAILRNLRYADAYPPTLSLPTRWHERLYAFHRGLAAHLHRFGLIYGLVALSVLVVYQPISAFGMLLFVFYVLGYIAVQCEYRHAFHLAFTPFWIMGFLVERGVAGVALIRKQGMPCRAWWMEALTRVALFILCCSALLLPPLALLRLYQERQVKPVLELGARAERRAMPVVPQHMHGWTLYSVGETGPQDTNSDIRALCKVLAAVCSPELRFWNVRGRMMVAEFKADAGVDWLIQKYDSAVPLNDFSQLTRVPYSAGTGDVVKYYFPVYELLMPYNEEKFLLCRNRFRGIALPDDKADAFLGLYEIKIPENMNLLMQFAHLDNRPPEMLYQRIGFSPDPLLYYQSEKNAVDNINLFEAAYLLGRFEDAHFLARAQLVLSRQPETRLVIAGRFFEDGALDDALDAALDIRGERLDETSRQIALLEMIGRQFLLQNALEQAERAFAAVWGMDPSRACVLRMELARVDAQSDPDKALEQYRQALLLEPDNEQGVINADLLFEHSDTLEPRIRFWRSLTEQRPDALLPWLRLGMSLEAAGDDIGAARAYTGAFRNHGDVPEAIVRHVLTETQELNIKETRDALDKALKEKPELTELAVSYLDKAGRNALSQGRSDDAMKWYALAAQYQPDNEWILLGQARCLVQTGQIQEALNRFEGLLDGPYGRDAVMGISSLLPDSETERLVYWQDLEKRHPGNAYLQELLAKERGDQGRILFEAGDYVQALSVLQVSCPEPCASADQRVLLCLARTAATGNGECLETLAEIVETQPELKQRALGWMLKAIDTLVTAEKAEFAERIARVAVDLAPEAEGAWLALIRMDMKREAWDTALDVCRKAIAVSGDITQIARCMDEVYVYKNTPEERLREWRQVQEVLPDSPVVLLHLARAFEANGRWSEAADQYAALIATGKGAQELPLYRACALLRAGDLERGMALVRDSLGAGINIAPVLSQLLSNTGTALADAGQYTAAEELFQLVVEANSAAMGALLQLGEVQLRQGKVDAALRAWKQILITESSGAVAAQAARLLYKNGDPDARQAEWRALYETVGDSLLISAYYLLAQATTGEIAEASVRLETLLREHPDCPEAGMAFGVLSCLKGDTESGVARIRTVAKDHPELVGDAAACLSEVALKDFAEKKLPRAEALLRAALILEPDNLSHCMNLGEVLLEEGRAEEAIEQFIRLLKIVPDSPRTAGLMDAAYRQKQDPAGQIRAWREIAEAHPDALLPKQRLKDLEARR